MNWIHFLIDHGAGVNEQDTNGLPHKSSCIQWLIWAPWLYKNLGVTNHLLCFNPLYSTIDDLGVVFVCLCLIVDLYVSILSLGLFIQQLIQFRLTFQSQTKVPSIHFSNRQSQTSYWSTKLLPTDILVSYWIISLAWRKRMKRMKRTHVSL